MVKIPPEIRQPADLEKCQRFLDEKWKEIETIVDQFLNQQTAPAHEETNTYISLVLVALSILFFPVSLIALCANVIWLAFHPRKSSPRKLAVTAKGGLPIVEITGLPVGQGFWRTLGMLLWGYLGYLGTDRTTGQKTIYVHSIVASLYQASGWLGVLGERWLRSIVVHELEHLASAHGGENQAIRAATADFWKPSPQSPVRPDLPQQPTRPPRFDFRSAGKLLAAA